MSTLQAAMRERMVQTFLAEARDLLRDLDDGLRQMRAGDHGRDVVARLFRAAHSIKGSGGMFGLAPLVGFTHVVENLLDRVRAGTLAPTEGLVVDLQAACDHIADLVEVLVADRGALDPALADRDASLREALARYDAAPGAGRAPVAEAPARTMPATGNGAMHPCDCWHISVRLGADVHRYGINPLSFIRDLESLGEITCLLTLADAMPDIGEMDPEACYLGFEIDLRADVDKRRIAEVFDFVQDCSELRILPPRSRVADFVELIRELPEPDARLGELLVLAGTLTREELDAGLATQHAEAVSTGAPPPLGEVLVEQQVIAPEVVQAGLDKQAQVRATGAAPGADAAFIRVRADQLDALINRVGELVIAGAGAQLLADCSGQAALREAQAQVAELVEDIRERALRLRMVPIGETFARFHRVVRDIERDLGKGIDLEIEGGDTELDKSVVDRLADPLVHLVRNAADHGLETTAARLAAGKPARGRIRLSASHEGGQVLIEISDDGRGLDRDRILAKGIERGVVQAGAVLTDAEVFALIFEAGFSTAAEVTDLSGRGVGMDVVRRNIAGMRGTIELDSRAGEGTTVRIRLPLTLAIIDGFLIGVGNAVFVLPLERVVECIELPSALREGQGYLDLRGHALPLLPLREQLQVGGTKRSRRQSVVVVDCDGYRVGLVVDALLGEFQTVIKPLGPLFAHLKGISGSTILGSGEVALILDVNELAVAAGRCDSRSFSDRQPGTPVASASSMVS